MTRNELDEMVMAKKMVKSHTSYTRHYVRRTGDLPAPKPYSGKFGAGFVTLDPNYGSSRYSFITYWLNK